MATAWTTVQGSYISIGGTGNKTISNSGTSMGNAYADTGHSSGKYYMEFSFAGSIGNSAIVGVGLCDGSFAVGNFGTSTHNSFLFTADGNIRRYGAIVATGYPYSVGDVIGLAVDYTTGLFKLYLNNTFVYEWRTIVPEPQYPCATIYATSASCVGKFADADLTYTKPVGYNAWDNSEIPLEAPCVLYAPYTYGTIALSNGNLTATSSENTMYSTYGILPHSSGKWYAEIIANKGGTALTDKVRIGIKNAASIAYSGDVNSSVGVGTDEYAYLGNGYKITNNNVTAYGTAFGVGPINIGLALDLDSGELTFYNNGVSKGVAFSGISGNCFLGCSVYGNSSGPETVVTVNFGGTPFAYTMPVGYEPWDTYSYTAGIGAVLKSLFLRESKTQTIMRLQ